VAEARNYRCIASSRLKASVCRACSAPLLRLGWLPRRNAPDDAGRQRRWRPTLEARVAERATALSQDTALDHDARRDLARLREAQQLLQAAAGDRLETTRLSEERQSGPALLAALAADASSTTPGATSEQRGPDVIPGSAAIAVAEEFANLSLSQIQIATSEAENLLRTAGESCRGAPAARGSSQQQAARRGRVGAARDAASRPPSGSRSRRGRPAGRRHRQ
jgi:hypothetical protein